MSREETQAAAADPRRAPRVAACCAVEIRAGGEIWTGATEDVGPGGCLLFTRQLPGIGAEIVLSLSSELVDAPLVALGRIAWARRSSVTRAGIAFSGEAADPRRSPAAWFRRLVSSLPLDARTRMAPRALGLDTRVFLGTPPPSHADLAPEELRLLRRIAAGATVGALAAAEGEALVFRALGRGTASLQVTSPGAVARWAQVLADATPQLAPRSARTQGTTTPLPAPRPAATDLAVAARSLRDVARDAAARAPRSPEVQRLYEAGVARLCAGDAPSAEALMRRALALAPEDRVLQRLVVQRFGRG